MNRLMRDEVSRTRRVTLEAGSSVISRVAYINKLVGSDDSVAPTGHEWDVRAVAA